MKSWRLLPSLLLAACVPLPSLNSEVIPPINHMRIPPGLPLPQTLHIERDDGQQWQLVIQQERDEENFIRFRFSLLDPLGRPLEHLLIVRGRRWKSDRLLLPNREIEELLNTLLCAINGYQPPVGQWQWSPQAPKAPLNEQEFPVEQPYPFQTWPTIRLCKQSEHCYQFTPLQMP